MNIKTITYHFPTADMDADMDAENSVEPAAQQYRDWIAGALADAFPGATVVVDDAQSVPRLEIEAADMDSDPMDAVARVLGGADSRYDSREQSP